MDREQVDGLRASVSELKDEVAILKVELNNFRAKIAADMKKVIEVVKKNVG